MKKFVVLVGKPKSGKTMLADNFQSLLSASGNKPWEFQHEHIKATLWFPSLVAVLHGSPTAELLRFMRDLDSWSWLAADSEFLQPSFLDNVQFMGPFQALSLVVTDSVLTQRGAVLKRTDQDRFMKFSGEYSAGLLPNMTVAHFEAAMQRLLAELPIVSVPTSTAPLRA